MTWYMQNEGHAVNYERIRRLMRLPPIYQKPDTSRPVKGHNTYPYLLGGIRVERPNRVWCADITYIPMRRGFLNLVAIMGWYTRKVLAWRISNTLEADFCMEALNEAIHKFAPPEFMNTDQGSQFTSFAWTDRLKRVGTRISKDGQGRCIDNIFIERLWRSLKYERVICTHGKRGRRLGSASGAGLPPTTTNALTLPMAVNRRRGLLQRNRNRSAGAGCSLNNPESCPKVGE